MRLTISWRILACLALAACSLGEPPPEARESEVVQLSSCDPGYEAAIEACWVEADDAYAACERQRTDLRAPLLTQDLMRTDPRWQWIEDSYETCKREAALAFEACAEQAELCDDTALSL